MYVRPISPLLFFGKSIPAILAIYFLLFLSLTLLELRVFLVDYKHFAFAADNLAIRAALFNRCSDFHDLILLRATSVASIYTDMLFFLLSNHKATFPASHGHPAEF